MQNFEELQVWKNGFEIAKNISDLEASFERGELYELRSQIRRSAVSIPSNIAEGCSRTSQKDLRRFLEISLGSCFELDTQLRILLHSTNKERSKIASIYTLVKREEKMLGTNGITRILAQE